MASPSRFQRIKLLQNFLIPHLNRGTFKDKLYWIDKSRGIFCIHWRHQSSSKFHPDDSSVFREWAVIKGLWNAEDTKAIMKAKQRVRAALLKLRCIKCIQKTLDYRIYKILNEGEKQGVQEKEVEPFEESNSNLEFCNNNFRFQNLQHEEIIHELFIDQLLSMTLHPQPTQ